MSSYRSTWFPTWVRAALVPALALTFALVRPHPLHASEPPPEPEPAPDCVTIAREAALAHPASNVFAARARAMRARGRADSAMPPAMADFQVWDFPLTAPEEAGKTMFMLGIEQRWPLASVRHAMLNANRLGVEAAAAEGRVASSDIAARVAHACIDWSAAERRAASLEGMRANAATLLEALRTSQVAGASAIGATLRAKAELAATERMLAMARAAARGARATLEAWTEVGALPEQAPALEAPERAIEGTEERRGASGEKVQGGDAPDAPGAAGAMDAADETAMSAMLAVREAEVRAARAEVRAATLTAKTPEFTVGGGLAYAAGEPLGLMAKIGIELPWLTSGPAARVDEARANVEAAQAQLDTETRAVRTMIAEARARIGEAKAAAEVLVAEEIPALERAATFERATLGAGTFELAAWIETSRALRASVVELAELAAARAHAEIDLRAAKGLILDDATMVHERKEDRP